MKCKHRPPKRQPYLEARIEANLRFKNGEKQKRCKHCRLWIWESDYARK